MKTLIAGSKGVIGPAVTRPLTKRGHADMSAMTASSSSDDVIETYIEGQMRRLNIPGVSLAIIEGDKIVYPRGFSRARPGGEAPSPETPFFYWLAHQIIHGAGGDAVGRRRSNWMARFNAICLGSAWRIPRHLPT